MTQTRRIGGSRPQAIRADANALFLESRLPELSSAPVVLTPASAPLDPIPAAAANRIALREHLQRTGAVLLRGCGVESSAQFEALVETVAGAALRYTERSSPRSLVGGHVYTSTDYPPDQPILLHNENAYAHQWPMIIAFFCETPAEEGGETPIADVRRVYARLPDRVRQAFETRQIRYVRNYAEGLGLPWTRVFQTTRRDDVEAFCTRAGYEFEWRGGDRLRTRRTAPAVRRHPITGELVWFNHALFFHVTSLPLGVRDTLRQQLDEEDWPHQTTFGDGTPIPDDMLADIRAAYDAETLRFSWQKGDVLLLDNMLVAHARAPFRGARRVLVCMADPYTDDRPATVRDGTRDGRSEISDREHSS
jgi:alpha-ketoglutarate-dependent taurine dioxygenase